MVEALRVAANSELDLVEVSPKSEPPVCRIMDYGKFKYQQRRRPMMRRRSRPSFTSRK